MVGEWYSRSVPRSSLLSTPSADRSRASDANSAKVYRLHAERPVRRVRLSPEGDENWT